MKGVYRMLQKAPWSQTKKWAHTPIRQGIPNIPCTEKRRQKLYCDSVANREITFLSANMNQHHQKTGVIHRCIIRLTSKQDMGWQLQVHYHAPYDNKNTEVSSAILQGQPYQFLPQGRGNPLTQIRLCHGALPVPGIPGNNHDHCDMVQKIFLLLYTDTGQKNQQKTSNLMFQNNAFYKIPEAWVIY